MGGYAALGSREAPAPVSLFASGTEYGNYLTVAIAILWAMVLGRKQPLALLPILLLLGAVFLTGSRGPVVRILIVLCIMWALLGHTPMRWIMRGIFALLIASIGLTWGLSSVDSNGHTAAQQKLQRQSEGLLNPGDSDKSTIGLHLAMMGHGYQLALKEPLGRGLGATTPAAKKFGGEWLSTEVDTANALVATGLIGGAIYHIILFLVFLYAIRLWLGTRSPTALALVGLLIVTALTWLGGGQYAVNTIVWFCVGAVDRLYRDNTLNPPSDSQ
jgi:hypothetical protein